MAQIARALARALRLDEDLAEAVALVHDFGHTPFGHTGEDALNERMKAYCGFDHNAQSLRIVTKLEHRYADFDGLNLSWETLEGLVKHNGPLLVHSPRIQMSWSRNRSLISTNVMISNYRDLRALKRNVPRLPTILPITPMTLTMVFGRVCLSWRGLMRCRSQNAFWIS